MKKSRIALIALFAAFAMLLSSCGFVADLVSELESGGFLDLLTKAEGDDETRVGGKPERNPVTGKTTDVSPSDTEPAVIDPPVTEPPVIEPPAAATDAATDAPETAKPAATDKPIETTAPVTDPPKENVPPFLKTPTLKKVSLPKETFTDPMEKKASEIIDGAIATALSCVTTMRDDRHSAVSYPYEFDVNGYTASMTEEEKRMLQTVVSAGRRGEPFTLSETEYPNLTDSIFTLYNPLDYCYPDIASYLSLDVNFYLDKNFEPRLGSVVDNYFDPYRDANYSVRKGKADLGDVMEADLLDHVVKRIVRFMPKDLSTYDKYYYLAVVICAQNTYDGTAPNCYTAFGALITGKSVCEGYSRAYGLLCREADLWCGYQYGTPSDGSHVWNVVKLDSGIYNVDVTWCDSRTDPISAKWYDYFMKTNADFTSDGHSPKTGVKSTGRFEPNPYQS